MTRRDRLMLLAVLSVVLLGAFWFLVLSPQRKSAASAATQLGAAKQALQTAQQQLSSGKQAEAAFRTDRTTIVKLGRVVPETDDIPTLLTQLQALADTEHVDFQQYSISSGGASAATAGSSATTATTPTGSSASNGTTNAVAPLFPPGSVQVTGGLGRTPITLQLEGTYFQLEKYLRAVQRFAVIQQKRSSTTGRLMIVDGFGFIMSADASTTGPSNANSKQPKLTANLSASVYFAPPLDTPAAPGAASSSAAGTATPGAPAPATSTATGTAAIGGLQ